MLLQTISEDQLYEVLSVLKRRYEQLFLWGKYISEQQRVKEKAKKDELLRKFKLNDLGDCKRCKLCQTRKNLVFGEGNPAARLMFIGEAPGKEEDEQGKPFVGRAGVLLTKLIEGLGLKRQDIYIANIIKCRPPSNRNPELNEIQSCKPFLLQQIKIIDPKVIVLLGSCSLKSLLGEDKQISKVRGRQFSIHGRMYIPTYHPAYILRNPLIIDLVKEDFRNTMFALRKVQEC